MFLFSKGRENNCRINGFPDLDQKQIPSADPIRFFRLSPQRWRLAPDLFFALSVCQRLICLSAHFDRVEISPNALPSSVFRACPRRSRFNSVASSGRGCRLRSIWDGRTTLHCHPPPEPQADCQSRLRTVYLESESSSHSGISRCHAGCRCASISSIKTTRGEPRSSFPYYPFQTTSAHHIPQPLHK